jgi:hypothetical protein
LGDCITDAEESAAGEHLGGDGVAFQQGVVELGHDNNIFITARR